MSKPGGSQSDAGQLHKEKLEKYVVHWAGLQKGQSMHCREIVSHFGLSGCGAACFWHSSLQDLVRAW